MKNFAVALLGLAVLVTSSAYADEFSLGASVGYVNIEDNDPGFDFEATDTGYKLFASYEFANHLGIEGGYIDFGEPNDQFKGLNGEIASAPLLACI